MKFCSVCQRCFNDEILSCSVSNHGNLSKGRGGNCEIIPNYRLELFLESTAAGENYRAESTVLKEPCLVKIFPSELFTGEPKIRENFLRETQDLSVINHPNVARIFERGMLEDGSVYLITEYFAGQNLRDRLDQEKVSEINALAIARQIAEGLDVIHTLDILHRNIRPENIIMTTNAENQFLVKIQNVDFGGIRQKLIRADLEANLSELRYFSPEQCNGKKVDEQTDIYALGIVLYEILAGDTPFNAADAETLIDKQTKENPPPVQIDKFKIRALLTHTLMDSLQKTKRLRLKNANIFARRLRYIEQIAGNPPVLPPLASHSKAALPDAILADLPTEELPHLESIVGEISARNDVFFEDLSAKNTILIEWEQPDDIPLLMKSLGKEDSVLAPEIAFSDHEKNEKGLVRDIKPQKSDLPKNTVFLRQPKFLLGGAFVVLVTLIFGGILLNQQFQPEKNIAQGKMPIEKATERKINSVENVKPDEQSANETVQSDLELPNYHPRETGAKKPQPISQTGQKKTFPKAVAEDCNCGKTIQNKPLITQIAERKVIVVKSAEKGFIEKGVDDMSVFNRPRIVKNPKF